MTKRSLEDLDRDYNNFKLRAVDEFEYYIRRDRLLCLDSEYHIRPEEFNSFHPSKKFVGKKVGDLGDGWNIIKQQKNWINCAQKELDYKEKALEWWRK